jgi:hypothetical protein
LLEKKIGENDMYKKKGKINQVELVMKEGQFIKGFTDLGDGLLLEYLIRENWTTLKGNFVSCLYRINFQGLKNPTLVRTKSLESKISLILIDCIRKNIHGYGLESSRNNHTSRKYGNDLTN